MPPVVVVLNQMAIWRASPPRPGDCSTAQLLLNTAAQDIWTLRLWRSYQHFLCTEQIRFFLLEPALISSELTQLNTVLCTVGDNWVAIVVIYSWEQLGGGDDNDRPITLVHKVIF